jgi:hypothetical protein
LCASTQAQRLTSLQSSLTALFFISKTYYYRRTQPTALVLVYIPLTNIPMRRQWPVIIGLLSLAGSGAPAVAK